VGVAAFIATKLMLSSWFSASIRHKLTRASISGFDDAAVRYLESIRYSSDAAYYSI
jgi:hypothetical protein